VRQRRRHRVSDRLVSPFEDVDRVTVDGLWKWIDDTVVVGRTFATNGKADAVLQWAHDAIADPFEADVNAGDFRVFHQFGTELANQFKPLFVVGEQFRPAFAAFDFDTAAFLGNGVEEFRSNRSARAADRIVARGARRGRDLLSCGFLLRPCVSVHLLHSRHFTSSALTSRLRSSRVLRSRVFGSSLRRSCVLGRSVRSGCFRSS